MPATTVAYDAIVLGGGRGSRLGGADKPALVLGGLSLADRAIRAVAGARAVAYVSHGVVPSAEPLDPRIRLVGEEPRWAGPVAAIAAGLAGLDDRSEPVTVVLAGDLVDPAPAVAALLAHGPRGDDGIIAIDPDGVRQPLLAIYRTAALQSAVAADGTVVRARGRGPSMHAVLQRLELRELALPAGWCADVDTPADAARHGIALPSEVHHARVA
jgi:molybdopterin-guanine dinucleotide biosynthesis protein A